jgi:hypothetical protein
MATFQQTFQLYNTTLNEHRPIENNVSFLDKTLIQEKLDQYIKEFQWPIHHRFVAFGNAGDSVIYENGEILQVSDSG